MSSIWESILCGIGWFSMLTSFSMLDFWRTSAKTPLFWSTMCFFYSKYFFTFCHEVRPMDVYGFALLDIYNILYLFHRGHSTWPQYRKRMTTPYLPPLSVNLALYRKIVSEFEIRPYLLRQRCFPWCCRGCTECEWLLRTECSFYTQRFFFISYHLFSKLSFR